MGHQRGVSHYVGSLHVRIVSQFRCPLTSSFADSVVTIVNPNAAPLGTQKMFSVLAVLVTLSTPLFSMCVRSTVSEHLADKLFAAGKVTRPWSRLGPVGLKHSSSRRELTETRQPSNASSSSSSRKRNPRKVNRLLPRPPGKSQVTPPSSSPTPLSATRMRRSSTISPLPSLKASSP